MEKENLNKEVWYRALKVFFFTAFILAQWLGSVVVFSMTDKPEVTPESFRRLGKIIKSQYPEYTDLSDADIGKRVYEKRPDIWLQQSQIVEYKNRYSVPERIQYYTVSFLIVSCLFWLLARIFHYIVLGTPIINLARRG